MMSKSMPGKAAINQTGPVITSYRYTHYDSSDAGGSYSNMISVRLNDPRGTGYTQLWLSRGTGAYTYDWTPETRYGSMRASVCNVFNR